MAILGHFWAFLAFRKSKNAVPAFVCIPLCLLSVANQGGKPSIAFLRNFGGNLSYKRRTLALYWQKVKKCVQVRVGSINLCPRSFLTSSLDSPPSNWSRGPRTGDRLNYFLFFTFFERYYSFGHTTPTPLSQGSF